MIVMIKISKFQMAGSSTMPLINEDYFGGNGGGGGGGGSNQIPYNHHHHHTHHQLANNHLLTGSANSATTSNSGQIGASNQYNFHTLQPASNNNNNQFQQQQQQHSHHPQLMHSTSQAPYISTSNQNGYLSGINSPNGPQQYSNKLG